MARPVGQREETQCIGPLLYIVACRLFSPPPLHSHVLTNASLQILPQPLLHLVMNFCINRPLGRRSPAKLILCIAAPVLLSAAVVLRGELAQLVSGTQQNNLFTVGDLEEANKSLREPVQLQAIDPTNRKLDSDVSIDSADEEADVSPAVAAVRTPHPVLHYELCLT